MFAFLLQAADPTMPATSYAIMNTLAMLGMQIGKYVTRFADEVSLDVHDSVTMIGKEQEQSYFMFCMLCWVMNALYALFVSMIAFR
jgi:hypothetical protein